MSDAHRKRPPHVERAIIEDDRGLLSAFGRKGGPIGGRIRGKQMKEDAAWRAFFKQRMNEEFQANEIAATNVNLKLLGLDARLLGAYPDHRDDSDYELLPLTA